MDYRHVAYNLTTGEVLMSLTANALKRHVARHTASCRAWGEPASVWVFSHHGTEGLAKRGYIA